MEYDADNKIGCVQKLCRESIASLKVILFNKSSELLEIASWAEVNLLDLEEFLSHIKKKKV